MNHKTIFLVLLSLVLVGLCITGCEYDVAQPLYYSDFEAVAEPVITEVTPSVATPGVNHIVIKGQNFGDGEGENKVYFDGEKVDVIESSATSLTVRRPELVSDDATIKVSSFDALVLATFEHYAIDPVVEVFSSFLEGDELSDITVDKNETIYVIQRTPKTVFKIDASGEKTEIGEAGKIIYDVKIGPQGQLILLANNKAITQMDVSTGEETDWASVSKKVSYGDFDQYGNFYVAGKKSDLIVLKPDLTSSAAGYYASDEIFCVRVFENDVYVLAEIASPAEGQPSYGVWKHSIDADGNVGSPELVVDWSTTDDYAAYIPSDMTFTAAGDLLIATDHPSPVFMITKDGNHDILYKNILTSTVAQFVWGTGNYIYQIVGGDDWYLMKIDMGAEGAPYYGR